MPGSPQGIPDWAPTIADLLKPQGYATGQFGKNHLGDRDSHLPTVHGFDEFLGNLYHLNAEEEPETYYYPKDPAFRKKYGPRGVLHTWTDGKGGQKIEDTGALTQARMETVDQEIFAAEQKFVAEAAKSGKPFFVWFNTTRMHVWTHLKKSAQGRTGIGLYPDGMVEHDDMVGAVLKQLDDLGIADNTIVVYGTDNGAETGTWPDGGTTPYHGEKGTTWEGGFRVPMVVRWPGVIKPGSIVNEIFSQEDWLPTFLAAAGVPDIVDKVKQGYSANGKTWKAHLDGYNFLPYFRGEAKKGPARGDLLLRPGRRTERRALERLEGALRGDQRQHRDGGARSARLAGDRQPARRPVREGAARIRAVLAVVRGQHLAFRAGTAEARGVPADPARVPVPAGQQSERCRHQLRLAEGDAGDEALAATRGRCAAAQLTRVTPSPPNAAPLMVTSVGKWLED